MSIPPGVADIGEGVFAGCTGLTSVTVPHSVASIEDGAFSRCTNLTGVYFEGCAPRLGSSVFGDAENLTVYYLPGTTGWGPIFGGRPTALWALPNPVISATASGFGVETNRFGFIISWATNLPVVVEVSSAPGGPNWSPVATNTLTDGSSYFSDPQWRDYPDRFYRVRSP